MHSVSRLVLALLAGSLGTAVVQASNVVDLEETSLDQLVGNGRQVLLDFWAPWCDHCQQLEPVYEELGDVFAHVKDKLAIAKVNTDESTGKSLVDKYGVEGLPTIKWIGADGETADYDPEGTRTLKALVDFVTEKSGLKPKLPSPPPPPPVVTKQLTPDNFDDIVNDPTKDVLVAFTATWCHHCKAMKPAYDLVAWQFRSEKKVIIANLDGDADINQALAKKYEVQGYPILKLFPRGSKDKKAIDYKLPRDEKNLVEFLNKYTGTERAVGGGLNDKAGRTEALDQIAADFMASRPSERKAIYKRTKPICLAAGKSGKQYLRIMDKLVNGTDSYLDQEKTRLLGLLKKHALGDEQLDEIKVKFNILSTFMIRAAAGKIADGVRVERAPEPETAPGVSDPVSSATETVEAVETEAKRVKEEL